MLRGGAERIGTPGALRAAHREPFAGLPPVVGLKRASIPVPDRHAVDPYGWQAPLHIDPRGWATRDGAMRPKLWKPGVTAWSVGGWGS